MFWEYGSSGMIESVGSRREVSIRSCGLVVGIGAMGAEGGWRVLGERRMFFFFKQKAAYEVLRSLVGSEICIRDRSGRRR